MIHRVLIIPVAICIGVSSGSSDGRKWRYTSRSRSVVLAYSELEAHTPGLDIEDVKSEPGVDRTEFCNEVLPATIREMFSIPSVPRVETLKRMFVQFDDETFDNYMASCHCYLSVIERMGFTYVGNDVWRGGEVIPKDFAARQTYCSKP